jgi:hypothetical protein
MAAWPPGGVPVSTHKPETGAGKADGDITGRADPRTAP